MRTKRIPEEESEHARAFLARIVRADFDGVESKAAKALGISQSGLHEFLAGNRGAGLNVLRAIADYADVSVEVVTGREEPRTPPLNRHPDWPGARAEAERLHPEIPVEYLDLVGRGHVPGPQPAALDGVLIAGLAREWVAAAARMAATRRSAG